MTTTNNNLTDQIATTAQQTFEAARQHVDQAKEQAKNSATEFLAQAGDLVSEVVDAVVPGPDVTDVVIAAAGKIAGETGQVLNGVMEGTGQVLNGVMEGTGQVLNGVAEGTGQILEGTGEVLGGLAGGLAEGAGAIIGGIFEGLGN